MTPQKLALSWVFVGIISGAVGLTVGNLSGKLHVAYSNVFLLGLAKDSEKGRIDVGSSSDLVFQGSLVYLKDVRGQKLGRLVSTWIEAGDDLQSRNFKAAREKYVGN